MRIVNTYKQKMQNKTKPKNPTTQARRMVILMAIILVALGMAILYAKLREEENAGFSGELALKDIVYQTSLGPRFPGSAGHDKIIDWIVSRIEDVGWIAEIQDTTINNLRIRNIIAKRDTDEPKIIIGAHYDTRMYADRDPDPQKRAEPVPGANDGASGVAVLLELARTLPADLDRDVWLVFFDAEDNGNILGWEWILGSQAFVRDYALNPESVVIIDMIGDKDLNINYEINSESQLSKEIWEAAARIGYINHFIPTPGRSILDDHVPFLQTGLRAIDIIDFDYPYWHTTQDTVDKVSAGSLQIVGDVLLTWLLQK